MHPIDYLVTTCEDEALNNTIINTSFSENIYFLLFFIYFLLIVNVIVV